MQIHKIVLKNKFHKNSIKTLGINSMNLEEVVRLDQTATIELICHRLKMSPGHWVIQLVSLLCLGWMHPKAEQCSMILIGNLMNKIEWWSFSRTKSPKWKKATNSWKTNHPKPETSTWTTWAKWKTNFDIILNKTSSAHKK